MTLGQRQGDLVIVAAGVKPGERVVTTGQMGVTPGGKVRVEATARTRPAAAPPARQPSHEPLRALHPPAGHDGGPDRLGGPLRRPELSPAPGERPARRRLPGDPGAGGLPGRQPRHDGQQHRDAARAPVHADHGARGRHLEEHAGAHEPDAPVRARQEHRRRRHRRPDGDLPGHRQPAGRPAVAADLLQDEPERSADHVHRADERLDHRRPALRLREHPGRPAHQHPARREPRGRVRHQVGHSHQGGSGGDVGARHLDRRPVGGHPRRHQLHRRRPARLGDGHGAAPAPRPARQRRRLPEPHRQLERRRAGLPARHRGRPGIRPGRAHHHAVLGAGLLGPLRHGRRSPSTGRPAPTPSRWPRASATWCRSSPPSSRARCASRRSTTARRRSSTRSTTSSSP